MLTESRNTAGLQRCPDCQSEDLVSTQSAMFDSELVECQLCKRAYEVTTQPDGNVKLVPV